MSRLQTRKERNKSILEDVKAQIERVNNLKNNSRYKNYSEMHKGLETLLAHYWSWYDMIALLDLIRRKMQELGKKQEFEMCLKDFQKECNVINLTYGNWILEDVIEFASRLIIDFPEVIQTLREEAENGCIIETQTPCGHK